jgi:nucleoside-diphosphate-sugar epimerase
MQHRSITEGISESEAKIVARILVTGAAGFIGTALCPALAAHGHQVVAGVRRAGVTPPGAEPLVLGDITPVTEWASALGGIETVIHLAQRAHAGPDPSLLAAEPSAVAALARSGAASGVKRLVLLSSVKAMGEATAPGRPFRADDDPRPEDAYGRAKLASERAAAEVPGIELVIIRPPLVHGPGVRANFRALIRLAASGMPLPFAALDNRRSLICRENLVALIALAATHPAASGQILLARDGEDLSTPALIRALAAGLGRKARLFAVPAALFAALRPLPRVGPKLSRLTLSLQVDDAPTRALLDWTPPIAAADALTATARAFAAGL